MTRQQSQWRFCIAHLVGLVVLVADNCHMNQTVFLWRRALGSHPRRCSAHELGRTPAVMHHSNVISVSLASYQHNRQRNICRKSEASENVDAQYLLETVYRPSILSLRASHHIDRQHAVRVQQGAGRLKEGLAEEHISRAAHARAAGRHRHDWERNQTGEIN